MPAEIPEDVVDFVEKQLNAHPAISEFPVQLNHHNTVDDSATYMLSCDLYCIRDIALRHSHPTLKLLAQTPDESSQLHSPGQGMKGEQRNHTYLRTQSTCYLCLGIKVLPMSWHQTKHFIYIAGDGEVDSGNY